MTICTFIAFQISTINFNAKENTVLSYPLPFQRFKTFKIGSKLKVSLCYEAKRHRSIIGVMTLKFKHREYNRKLKYKNKSGELKRLV